MADFDPTAFLASEKSTAPAVSAAVAPVAFDPASFLQSEYKALAQDQTYDPVSDYGKAPSKESLARAVAVSRERANNRTFMGDAWNFGRGVVTGLPSAVTGLVKGTAGLIGNAWEAAFGSPAEAQRARTEAASAVQLGSLEGFHGLAQAAKLPYRLFHPDRDLTDEEWGDRINDESARQSIINELKGGQIKGDLYQKLSGITQTPDELAKDGTPVRPERVESESWVGDPRTYLLDPAAKLAGPLIGRTITSPVLRGAAKAIEDVTGAVEPVTHGAGLIGSLGYALYSHSPLTAGLVFAGKAAQKAAPGVARMLREAGEEAGGAFPPEVQSLGAKAFKSGAQGAVAGAALSTPYMAGAQSPEEAGQTLGGGIGLGGVIGAAGGITNTRKIDAAGKAGALAREGAALTYGSKWDSVSQKWMPTLTPDAQTAVNIFKGRFNGFQDKNGNPVEIHVAGGQDYQQATEELGPDSAADSRGFISKDGTNIFLNADYGKAPGAASATMSHEAGGHLTEFLADIGQQHDIANLRDTLKTSLYDQNAPTKPFQRFIDRQKAALKAGGASDQLLNNLGNTYFEREFLAETATKILKGQNIAEFNLPKPLKDRLLTGTRRWLRSNGIMPKTGADIGFGGQEIKEITQQMQDILYKQGAQSEAMRADRAKNGPRRSLTKQMQEQARQQRQKPTEGERIVSPAIQTPDGLLTRPNHPQIIRENKLDPAIRNSDQAGFTTSTGRFVTREEAADIAEKAGQLKGAKPDKLHSQDLKPETTPPMQTSGKTTSPTVEPVQQGATATATLVQPTVQTTPRTEPQRTPLPSRPEVDALVATAKSKAVAAEKNTTTKAAQERIYDAQVNAIMDAIGDDPNGLHRSQDASGNEIIVGSFDRTNPYHAALADLAGGITEKAEGNLNAAQDAQGDVRFIRYNSAKSKTEAAPWERIGMTERRGEYAVNPPEARVESTPQHKTIIPIQTKMLGGRPQEVVITLENLLHNAEGIKQWQEAKGRTFPYTNNEALLARDAKVWADNIAHGWNGRGTGPLKQFPDSGFPQLDPNYTPETIPDDRFNVLNMTMFNEEAGKYADRIKEVAEKQQKVGAAKTDKDRARLQGVLERANTRLVRSEEAANLARENNHWIDEASGESNKLRAQLKAEGFNSGEAFKSIFETLDPEHILAMSDKPLPMEEGDTKTIRPTSFEGKVTPSEMRPMADVPNKAVSGAFMPVELEMKNDNLAQAAWMKQQYPKGVITPEIAFTLGEKWRTINPDAKAAAERYQFPEGFLKARISGPLEPGINSEELRRSLEAYEERTGEKAGAGSIDGFRAAAKPLVQWARKNGRMFSDKLLDLVGAKGGEHSVIFTPGRVLKVTEPDTAGGVVKFKSDGEPGVFHGTLPDYVRQIEQDDKLAEQGQRIEGVMRSKDGSIRIVTSQPSKNGEEPTQENIQKDFTEAGFVPVAQEEVVGHNGIEAWYNPESNLALWDAKPENIIKTDNGELIPIDIKAFTPTGKSLEWIKNHVITGEEPNSTPAPTRRYSALEFAQ